MLVKVNVPTANEREEIKRLVDIFRGRIIDVGDANYTVEMTGTGDKLDAFIKAIDPPLIAEVVRSGVSGIARGNMSLHV
ncbi:MAG: acetolactate synthase small subunit [Candidatus Parabeggiatoa sp. nov. 2]|nr:MAG: acetolactate synthase small subunit [Beggiatoa sp. 4572_84]